MTWVGSELETATLVAQATSVFCSAWAASTDRSHQQSWLVLITSPLSTLLLVDFSQRRSPQPPILARPKLRKIPWGSRPLRHWGIGNGRLGGRRLERDPGGDNQGLFDGQARTAAAGYKPKAGPQQNQRAHGTQPHPVADRPLTACADDSLWVES